MGFLDPLQETRHCKMGELRYLLLLAVLATVHALPTREGKLVGLFNYVTFPNDVCVADGTVTGNNGALNGNCYTKQECDQLGGTASGECAEGYGVCCVFTPACGATIKQNLTYYIQQPTQNPPQSNCAYTICPISSNVNRIRLDFTRFVIGDPVMLEQTPTNRGTGAATGTNTLGSSLGDCVDDTFSVSSSARGSPVICGVNSGHHMFVDTDGTQCVVVSFSFGGDTIEREYEIRALQYAKSNELGGPPGCLQFFIATTAAVISFDWRANADGSLLTPATAGLYNTHLSNLNYDICIRRARGFCGICWTASTPGTATPTLGSFGLSTSPAAAPQSQVGTACTDDFIVIPNGEALPPMFTSTTIAVGMNKYCGRYLNPTAAQTADEAVCSRVTPFTLSVFTDANEVAGAAGTGAANTNEASSDADTAAGSLQPLGTMGFALIYSQQACT